MQRSVERLGHGVLDRIEDLAAHVVERAVNLDRQQRVAIVHDSIRYDRNERANAGRLSSLGVELRKLLVGDVEREAAPDSGTLSLCSLPHLLLHGSQRLHDIWRRRAVADADETERLSMRLEI